MTSSTGIKFRYFRLEDVPFGATCLLIGVRGSGKSTAAINIMCGKKHIPYGICVNPTETAHKTWGHYLPPVVIYTKYSATALQNLMKAQERQATRDEHGFPSSPAFFIADDCLYNDKFTKDNTFKELMLNGRHMKIFTLITAQYVVGIPRMLRKNFDYVFLLPDPQPANRITYYEQFGTMFKNFKEFNSVFSLATEDFGVMVIHQTPKNPQLLSDYVFWFKPQLELKYRIGCDDLWKYSRIKSNLAQNVMDEAKNDERGEVGGLRIIKQYPRERNDKPDLYAVRPTETITEETIAYESSFGEKI